MFDTDQFKLTALTAARTAKLPVAVVENTREAARRLGEAVDRLTVSQVHGTSAYARRLVGEVAVKRGGVDLWATQRLSKQHVGEAVGVRVKATSVQVIVRGNVYDERSLSILGAQFADQVARAIYPMWARLTTALVQHSRLGESVIKQVTKDIAKEKQRVCFAEPELTDISIDGRKKRAFILRFSLGDLCLCGSAPTLSVAYYRAEQGSSGKTFLAEDFSSTVGFFAAQALLK